MAATALIQLTQGANVGVAGQALFGTIGTAVVINNNNNTGVLSWQIDLVYVPPGSSLSVGTIAHSDNGSTPTVSFIPDVRGPYRIILYVWDAINRVGVATNIDIRNFGIKQPNGIFRPAPQIWPRPLPPVASGEPGNKPDENNFAGQDNGWSGSGTDGLLDNALSRIDAAIQVAAGTQTGTTGPILFSNSNGISFGMSGSNQVTASYTVPSLAGLISAVNASAGTTSNNLSAFVFSNSNNVSFGLNGSTITASITVPAQTAQTQNIVVPTAGTQTATSGTVAFVNSNGISFGMSGSSQITASYTVPSLAGLISGINASAGTTSNNLSALVFSNSNNFSFGLNGSTITGSYTVPTVTNSSATISAGTTSGTLSDLVFSNSNGLSFGLNNGTITGSYTVPNVPAQTVQTQNIVVPAASNTTYTSGTVVFTGSNAVTIRSTTGQAIVIDVPVQTAQTQSNVQGISAGTQVGRTGDIVFSNSNGFSFGMSNSSIVTASYTVPSTAGLISAVNASAGTTSNNLTAFVFSNSNNISFGLNGSTITGSIPTGATATGNFGAVQAGTQTATSGTVVFSNSNGISFGMSGSTQITASYTVPSTAGLVSAINLSAGTTSNNASAFTFSNSNNISFGLNGSTVTASASYSQSTAPAAISAGTTQATNGTVIFSNSNGISFGMNNGVITATVNPGAAAGIAAIQGGTQTATSGTVIFSDSNGISFGLSGSSRMTASYTVPVTAGLISFVNFSAGTTSNNASAITFSNSNGISFGMNGSTITGSVATSLTNINFSAGTTSNNLSALVFSNSNNVSFGLNGSTVTATITVPAQTNQTEGFYAIGNTTGQSSSSTFDARTFSISGAGIASVGYSGNALVISVSAAQTVQTQNVVVPSAGTQTATSGTVIFSNSNGLAFGMSNSSIITGSYTVPSIAGLISAVNISAGTTSNNATAFVFSNSNNVSFGLNGSTVTATISVPAQTAQTVGLFALGNTTQNSSTTLDARSLSFNGLGIITAGFSNGSIQLSATQSAQTQSNVQGISAGTQVGRTSDIVFSNSNGISFGMSGSSQVTASYTVPSIVGLISAINVSGGTTSNNLSAITFSNSNGVSFGLNGSTLTGSVATSLTNVNLSAGTTSQNLSAFVFSNSNGVSFGLNGSTVTGSIATQTNQTIGLYALGNTTQNSSTTLDARTLSFNGLGAASVGYSNGSIQISVPNALTNINISAGTTSNNLTAFVFSNSNNVSFGLNGSTVTATITVPAQTNQSIGFFATGNTTQNSSTTLDARSLTFNGLGIITAGFSNGSIQLSATQSVQTQSLIQAIYDGANSITTGTIRFTNANGVSFSINGQTISGSVAIQTNQTEGLYAIGNTTGQSSSSTFDARTMSISGAGIASVGYSGNALVISVPTGAPSPVNFSAGTTSSNLGSVVFSNSNGVSFGLNGATITASAAGGGGTLNMFALGNTTQNSSSTIGTGSISFNALGAMTMGFSNGSIQVSAPPSSSLVGVGGISISTNGSTISISGDNYTNFEPFPMLTSTATFAPGAGSWYFQPFMMPANLSGGRINRLFSMSGLGSTGILAPTSSASFSSASTGSRSVSYSYVNSAVLYSLGVGTNSSRLESFWSNTISFGINHSVSVSTNGATTIAVTNAATISYIASIDVSGGYTTTTLASSTNRTSAAGSMNSSGVTAALSSLQNILSGPLVLPIGFNTTILPGNYWLAQAWNSASTTGGTAANVFGQVNQVGILVPNIDTVYRLWGQTITTSNSQINPGRGIYSASSASPPSTVAFTQIGSFATNLIQYFNWVNSTI